MKESENKGNNQTPLRNLCYALCRQSDARLFVNQLAMYQLLIPFISDNLQISHKEYAPVSVDELIMDIRRYLVYMYKHPSKDVKTGEADTFRAMHLYIYCNLANSEIRCQMSPFYGNKANLSVTTLRGLNHLDSNISNVISNKRSLPKKCIKLLCANHESYIPLLYRCFWMLQYYFVYYETDICSVNRRNNPLSHVSSQFIEYFSLTDQKSNSVFAALHKYCKTYSSFFHGNTSQTMDLLVLSRVILDTIIEQTNLRQDVQLEKIADASMFAGILDEPRVTEQEQYMEFRKYVDGFDRDSIDRYNILLKFAPTNCYAANELAIMYLWGKTFLLRNQNYFELEINHKEAIKWFLKAIENSDPPLQSACWSLSYTLTDMHYISSDEREAAEKKAIEYLKLAGEYPAAYNRIAYFLFRDANQLYKEHPNNEAFYEDILLQFLSAIRLADKAGEMHWFYGNNQIAIFLKQHKEDKKLLLDLTKRLKLHVPFDVEAQLKYSASYHNPWALKELAKYYVEQNRYSEAEPLFREAMDANYNAAFYEAAMYLCEKGSDKWWELMTMSSNMFYPRATYELAVLAKDNDRMQQLIALCKEQIFAEKNLDTDLLGRLNALTENAPN